MPDLAHFRHLGGPVTGTRYPDLHIWRQDVRLWRILATDTGGDTDVTGPPYASRDEALSNLDATARMWHGQPEPDGTAAVKAQALREAADALDALGRGCGPEYAAWLRERADATMAAAEGTMSA